jgi:putative endonuclease
MYCTYILQSQKNKKYYIGSCEDVEIRVKKHNSGQVRATKAGIPWVVVCKEFYESRSEAVRRERQIKSYKGGNAFKKLIK